MSEKVRGQWGTKLGLILAMAGNAIGLGNFWRFPYQAASNGGGAFMLPYFAALLILGLPLMLSEWSIGKYGGKYGHGTLGPMMYLQAREGVKPKTAIIFGALCGGLAFAITLLVNSYYNHIIGWTLGYAVESFSGAYMDQAKSTGEFFVEYVQDPMKIFVFWPIALIALAIAVMRGVEKGIEAWARVMMPVLYVFGIILAIRSLTMGSPVNPEWSSLKGLNFIWNPDFTKLSWRAALAAAGQIFFTLSIGMGIICNYASYMKPDDDVVVSSIATISLNEFAEIILGGSIVIPIAFAFLGPDGIGQSIGLSFIALPNVFRTMGGGQFFGGLWFLLLFFAGFTSAIAMYNYLTALIEEDLGIDRKIASWMIFVAYIIVGLPVGLEQILNKTAEFAYFSEVDNWVGTYLLLILGFVEIIVVAFMMKDKALVEINRGGIWKVPPWFFKVFNQFLTPVFLFTVVFFATIDNAKAGYFRPVPDFVADKPILIPWVIGARIVVLSVFVLGFIQSYISIKKNYGKELEANEILIKID